MADTAVIFSTHITADLERCADFSRITNGMLAAAAGRKTSSKTRSVWSRASGYELTDGLRRAMVGIRTYATGFDVGPHASHTSAAPTVS